MAIFWTVILGGIIVFIFRTWQRKCDDAEAFEWANRREPIIVKSEHAFDKTAEARANEYCQKLAAHGNKHLLNPDGTYAVWCVVYRANMDIFKDVQALEQNHSRWYDAVTAEMAQRKADWIAKKSGYIRAAAGQAFAGQVRYNQN